MPEFNPLITFYNSINALRPPVGNVLFLDVLNDIRSGKYKKIVDSLQGLPEEQYKKKKKNLPAVTFAGTFKPVTIPPGEKHKGELSYRRMEGLDEFSHIILIDVDKLTPEQMELYNSSLRHDPYVLAFFISPSRAGLKILFRESTGNHATAWAAVNNYLNKAYGIPIDPTGKNIDRLCFVSEHEDLHYNADCEIIHTPFVADHTPAPPAAQPKKTRKAASGQKAPGLTELQEILAKCHEITQQSTPLPDGGGYNKYTNVFALQANRYRVSEADCWSELESFFPFAAYQDQRPVVASVYSKFHGEHGNWPFIRSGERRAGSTTQPAAAVAPGNPNEQKEEILFWYPVFGKKNNNGSVPIEDYKVSFYRTLTYLGAKGYCKYKLKQGHYQLIEVNEKEKVVDAVNELIIKESMFDFILGRDDEFERERVSEKFLRASKTLCGPQVLDALRYYKPELRRDTATTATLYFGKCFVQITAEKIETKPYSELEGFIWKKQMNDFNFRQVVEWEGCDAAEFLDRAILGGIIPKDARTDIQKQMMMSVHTALGYLLHTYKHPGRTKAVIATDGILRRGKENEGRTGKSLTLKMLAEVVNVTRIDGRNFNMDKPFPLQKVQVDSRIIDFDDAKKGLDFTRFFSIISEDLDVEKKNQDIITLEFQDSPKWYISINSTLKGDGSSVRDRQHIIEFSNHYSDTHKPEHEFGRMFFSGWEEDEWERFYSFMVYCLQLYLQHNLVPFPLENYGMNKLIDRAGEEFIDFMDDTVLANIDHQPECPYPGKSEYVQLDLYNAYVKDIPEKFRPKINEFTTRVKLWADANNLVYNPRNHGERDRRNSITYMTFVRPNASLPGTVTDVPDDPQEHLPF